MGPYEQNQHFAELRQKICLNIHVVVLLTCLPSLDGKLGLFCNKKVAKVIAKLESDRLYHPGMHHCGLKIGQKDF